jgi:hypothetical protein
MVYGKQECFEKEQGLWILKLIAVLEQLGIQPSIARIRRDYPQAQDL